MKIISLFIVIVIVFFAFKYFRGFDAIDYVTKNGIKNSIVTLWQGTEAQAIPEEAKNSKSR
jgi:hypothetical protein